MQGVNKVIIVGTLGSDPEVKAVGKSTVARLSVATNESWTDDRGKQTRTEWHRVQVWGKLAEICGKYLAKGRPVYVEGKLQTRQWEDQQGQKRYTTEIVASTVQFLPDGKGRNENSSGRSGRNSRSEEEDFGGSEPMFDDSESMPDDGDFSDFGDENT